MRDVGELPKAPGRPLEGPTARYFPQGATWVAMRPEKAPIPPLIQQRVFLTGGTFKNYKNRRKVTYLISVGMKFSPHPPLSVAKRG